MKYAITSRSGKSLGEWHGDTASHALRNALFFGSLDDADLEGLPDEIGPGTSIPAGWTVVPVASA